MYRVIFIFIAVLGGGAFGLLLPHPKAPTVQVAVSPTPSATVTATPAPTSTPAPILTLVFGGDVMLGRTVQTNIETYGGEWPFSQVASTLKSADITVVNLESPIRSDASKTALDSLVLRGDPEGLKGMVLSGIDVSSLANNHIPDMGVKGAKETRELLQENDIQPVGAGTTPEEAKAPVIIERQGVKVAFLSYAYGVNFTSPGVYFQVATPALVTEQVQAAKTQADAVIVLCHCGTEYATLANAHQKSIAQAAAEAGAALYVGHHPHVPQPFTTVQGMPVVYSLGNLVFDQQPGQNRDRSALLQITLQAGKVTTAHLLPYQIKKLGQPQFLTADKDKEAVWQAFSLPGGQWSAATTSTDTLGH